MSESYIVDAHAHLGPPGTYFVPESRWTDLLPLMDAMGIRCAICANHLSLVEGFPAGAEQSRRVFEESGGRLFYLGVFNPRHADDCLASLRQAVKWPGFVGIKIHPSFHRTAAEDAAFEPVWRFAAENDLPILTHSWSASEHNPSQQWSTPDRFERFVAKFPGVRLVLGHAGGRGTGRSAMVRLVNQYPNVYTDLAGDVFCRRLLETLTASIPADRILFGSDFPWLDPRANLVRVFLSGISDEYKKGVLCNNASKVYRLGTKPC